MDLAMDMDKGRQIAASYVLHCMCYHASQTAESLPLRTPPPPSPQKVLAVHAKWEEEKAMTCISVQGRDGEDGAAGEDGDQGMTGEPGVPGPQGPDGPPGEIGFPKGPKVKLIILF